MKIMLDECITEGPAEILIDFFAITSPPVQAEFLPTYYGSKGLKDRTWAQALADEGGWCVISGDRDRARKSQKKRLADGPPLPTILPRCGITAVYLSGSIQRSPSEVKVQAVISTWRDIKMFFERARQGESKLLTKRGNGFVLRDY